MKKKILPILLLLLALGFLSSMFIKSSFGEDYGTNIFIEGNSKWILQIDGAVSTPINLTLNELAAMPRSSVYAELYCYGRLITKGIWTGVSLSSVLEKAEFNQQARSVNFYAQDGYGVEIPINEGAIIAYWLDGQPLPETLRLVIPEANGDRWIGMITHITVSMNASSPSPPATSIFMDWPALPQQSSTPQLSPTPQPTSSPSPNPSPLPTTPTPATDSTTSTTTYSNPKPLPITWTVTTVTTVASVSAGLIVLFRKRSK